MTDLSLDHVADFAGTLADVARTLARAHFRTTTAFERKADESPVTVADKAIEAALRAAILARFPGHAILGEEAGMTGDGHLLWVLDPIDGTKSFITGMPLFGALIAFARGGVPRVGVIEMPALGERWVGGAGGATFNGQPARASGCTALDQARVYTSSPDFFTPDDWARYDALSRRGAIRRFGGDCYQYGLLASGHCDLVVETALQPYDFMALVPVVAGAGGVMTDWQGRPLGLASDGRVVASATPALHEVALRALNG
ncbi:inositol monophosphatase family protein [Xanthobacter sp. V4C-4]|uniref:inositol monophosphatase family protein n=1 Tax=Xanthobacter cornucopiae TaxID=3119924 RepID=UPI0037265AC8